MESNIDHIKTIIWLEIKKDGMIPSIVIKQKGRRLC